MVIMILIYQSYDMNLNLSLKVKAPLNIPTGSGFTQKGRGADPGPSQ